MKPRSKVIFSPAAQREIEALEIEVALQLAKDIRTYLETVPLPSGKTRIKKMSGFQPHLYRLRSGDYRAYFRILSGTVVILAIIDKKDAERLLKKLR